MSAPLTSEQQLDLQTARHLVEHGIPVFRAVPDNGPLGFKLPHRWQATAPSMAPIDLWRPGDALCMVTGVLVDVLDVDPRNGGDEAALGTLLPKVYGKADTPSQGTHLLIASLGVAKGTPFPGIDLQAGTPDGEGRGFVFIAPTVRPSRVSGEMRPYRWRADGVPDVEFLAVIGGDNTGAPLRDFLEDRTPATPTAEYDGPHYDELLPSLQAWATRETAAVVEWWRTRLQEAEQWEEGERDQDGRGWEALSRDFAWALAMMAACPWSNLDEESAEMLYDLVLPEALAADGRCANKWDQSLVRKAAGHPVIPPPWDDFSALVNDNDSGPPPSVNVTNEANALKWLQLEIGTNRLTGMFRRGFEIVFTPRIGQRGYIPPKSDRDDAGPAQVRRIEALELATRVDHGYAVVRGGSRAPKPCLFPQTVASRSMSSLDLLPNLCNMLRVTHTPLVREDGSILDRPGYDEQSEILYLPEPTLAVPEVPDRPTPNDVHTAGKMVLDMVADFPFVSPHDRANYLGALLTPLLRSILPPPYKLVAIGAPQRGSGKSLLAWIMRELHGGVFKADFPSDNDELRKFITAVLDTTTGPVVQFDNVTGILKSGVFEGLLTEPVWNDRILGSSSSITLQNDRLWVVTGNNIRVGGDMERRTLWVTIDAKMEHPEERQEFRIPGLEGWVTQNRGELLQALLVLIRGWVVAGRPTHATPTTDSFGHWVAVLRGILKHARLGDEVGVVAHEDSKQTRTDPEDEEWGTLLAAVYQSFGTTTWTARDLIDRVVLQSDFSDVDESLALRVSDLPSDLAEKIERPYVSRDAVSRSLGMWLSNREGKIVGGFSVRKCSTTQKTRRWKVVPA